MPNCKLRTLFFLFLFSLLYCSLEKVSAQDSIDQLIVSAANSSEEFVFMQDGGEFVIKTELDMLFTKEQWSEIVRLNNTNSRMKRKAIRSRNFRWTNREVPYTISGYFSSSNRHQVNLAINEWNHYTCLKFRPARSNDRNRISIQNGGGCSSYVGMRGGNQAVSLAPNCRIKKIIVHELGHAIGFQHEQTRPDRDNYVYIIRQNIPPNMYYNFQRYSTNSVNDKQVPYDYTSVMHYGAYAFSFNGQRTIQTKNSRYQNIIGKAPGLSFRDIKLANLIYNCGSHCGGKTCKSPGFLDKHCQCICPGPSPSQPTRKCSGGGGGSKDCVDKNSQCGGWAAIGECTKNPDYMLENCKKSCKKCGGGGGGGEDKGDCVNKHKNCNDWATRGECNANPVYMNENCKKACGKCEKIVCVDKNQHCPFWASIGECSKNPNYMLSSCQKSCKKCSSGHPQQDDKIPKELQCTDQNSKCAGWASVGECKKNPNYMLQYCKKSCEICSTQADTDKVSTNCYDYNILCSAWAAVGECRHNPAYMFNSCQKSCKVCVSHLDRRNSLCYDFHSNCNSWQSKGYCATYKDFMHATCRKSCGICR